jgi:hypothetical protein
MATHRKFDSIHKKRERIDHLIIGVAIAFAGVVAGLLVVGVNAA